MKNFQINALVGRLSFMAILFSAQAPAQNDWTVQLIQEQLDGSGTFPSIVNPNGSGVSMAPIGVDGAEFTLWALRQKGNEIEETLIDTEVVGAYEPTGSIRIITPDSDYKGAIPRTRIDQGYKLRVPVSGLILNDTSAPLAATRVLLDHNVASYSGGMEDANLGVEQDFAQRALKDNKTFRFNFSTANIPGTDVYADAGMEYVRLYSYADATTAKTLLGEGLVQVWPMARAAFTGIEENAVYKEVPEVRVELTNLYPDSETWLVVHEGTNTTGEGERVNEAAIVVDDDVPRNTTLVFRELTDYVTEAGNWTFEVITETPFGKERLAEITIGIENTLKLRGSFQSLPE